MITEKDLAKQIGVDRMRLAKLRVGILSAEDFGKHGDNAIRYTEIGAKKMMAVFLPNVPMPEIAQPTEFDVVAVKSGFIRNPRVLMVKRVDNPDGEQFTVFVHNSVNFRPGMVFKVRQMPTDTIPTIVGRSPSAPGKWRLG